MSCSQTTSMHACWPPWPKPTFFRTLALYRLTILVFRNAPYSSSTALARRSALWEGTRARQQAGLSPLLRSSWFRFLFRDHRLASGPGEDEHVDSEQASLPLGSLSLSGLWQSLVRLQGLGAMEWDGSQPAERHSLKEQALSSPWSSWTLTRQGTLRPGDYCSAPPPEVAGSAHGPMRRVRSWSPTLKGREGP